MRRILLAAVLLLSLSGCGGSSHNTTLSVFAESSLTEVLAELDTRYAQLNPGVTVHAVFAGTQELERRIEAGQQSVDVVIASDEQTMTDLRKPGLVGDDHVVAHNSLEIAVAPGNPLRLTGPASLAAPKVRVALSAYDEASGRYAQRVLAAAGVSVTPGEEEIDVRSVLDDVRTGQADAGIVYATDILAAGAAASGVPIPAAQNVDVAYPAAVASGSHHGGAAKAFVAWLTSPEAQAILAKFGFGTA